MLTLDTQTLLPALVLAADWAWPKQHDYTPLPSYPSPTTPQGLWSHLTEKQLETGSKQHEASGSRQRFPTRHVALALAWALLADRLLLLAQPAQTTGLVCPSGTVWPAAGLVQLVRLGLDACALFLVGRRRRSGDQQPDEKPVVELSGGRLAADCVFAALAMLCLLVVTSPFATTSLREIAATPLFRGLVVRDLLVDSVLMAGVLVAGGYLLAFLAPTTLALLGGVAFISVHRNFEPIIGHGVEHPTSTVAILLGTFTVLSLAFLSHHTLRHDTDLTNLHPPEKPPHKKRLAALLTILTLLLTLTTTRALLTQPLDALRPIEAGQSAATAWLATANTSQNARQAAKAYKARHNGLPPPPGFDKWFAFARAHASPVVDAFDQIHSDLAPFWGLSPAELRAATAHVLAQKDMGIGGLSIRNGTVEILPGTPGTHAWMMEAWREMIAPFAAHLPPDMDLAFSIDDECRVAVPLAHLAQLHRQGLKPRRTLAAQGANGHPLRGWFSNTASPPWGVLATGGNDTSSHSPPFSVEKPRLSVYDSYIAPTCAPHSAALQQKWWDGGQALASARGGVVAAAAPDLCERPDLAWMHGFLVSPGAWAVTQRAMPIFSQARVSGFNDVLVPSPWHFADKVVVNETQDVEWAAKKDVVFWRGSASDGLAEAGRWPAFMRARLVNLAKGFHARWATTADAPAIDVSFSGEFAHCDRADCRAMAATFYGASPGLEPPPRTDFQEHWAFRHLIDVDGAGFSGRFLPFLRSKSTVYRATLFRTWYDERVFPWKHYVPLDVSLSGLWDVVWLVSRKFLAKGPDFEMPLARQIGADGRDWAAKALRKEDMQVYMFRLLLEWGRLVDDDREELGYDP